MRDRPGYSLFDRIRSTGLVSKYVDHLPLERQVKMMKRDGLDVDLQMLWDYT